MMPPSAYPRPESYGHYHDHRPPVEPLRHENSSNSMDGAERVVRLVLSLLVSTSLRA